MAESSIELVVFSDDWGRHPSSCQHLIRELIEQTPALWVNTIGMRFPKLSLGDVKKVAHKCRQWFGPKTEPAAMPKNLRVINPQMYPGFRTRWQRQLNSKLLSHQINRQLDASCNTQRIAITTLPIVADLVGKLNVDHWIYYCVDDFSVWPGLDSNVMQVMEQQLTESVDQVIAVSDTLVKRLSQWTNNVDLLTHGIDLAHWQNAPGSTQPHWAKRQDNSMLFLFWGLIDQRLDVQWCLKLADYGKLVLVGPIEYAAPELLNHPNIVLPGPTAYGSLPELAQHADVLVMPYADLPVTRAMQPLKFKEYLATGKPIVTRNLPGIRDWFDAADQVNNVQLLITVAVARAIGGLPASQRLARKRLENETWQCKAQQL
ncbi:MAG: glycosyltransferase, partial [Phycisphaeraceae bacterium]|nr:glycosyltransferase [Phycisphaeraceae bacterium]